MLLPFYGICCVFVVTLIWIVQKLLATAPVSSLLDYCNPLLYGIADIDLTRLQCVHNQLARLVTICTDAAAVAVEVVVIKVPDCVCKETAESVAVVAGADADERYSAVLHVDDRYGSGMVESM